MGGILLLTQIPYSLNCSDFLFFHYYFVFVVSFIDFRIKVRYVPTFGYQVNKDHWNKGIKQ